MKLQDKETLNVADTVKDVLEGKAPVKEMDPKKHVSKKGDKFVVVNKDGDVVKSFDNEDDANKYAVDNHDDLMKEGPEEPRAKGEKEFKDKHVVKKSGMKDDGTNVKEETEEVDEGSNYKKQKSKSQNKSFKKVRGRLTDETSDEGNAFGKAVMAAKEKGQKTFVFAGKKYNVTGEEVDEMSDKQKKYQAFFNKALKKFGVKSPDELEGKKKKEFFDYVDANYEADNESD